MQHKKKEVFEKSVWITIEGDGQAVVYAAKLILASKFFECDPLPDNEWLFIMKNEPGIPEL